ncbi:MAG: hypothetical protein M1819_002084 [Sarea resinae]|nr:MAG: hypothetical protein M1819_002084 [Sarea resinae]
MSYTFSKTWSPSGKEMDNFFAIQSKLSDIAPNCEAMSWKFQDWLAFRVGILEEEKIAMERKARLMNVSAGKPDIRPAFGGLIFDHSRGAVLCFETIWCRCSIEDERTSAPWPSFLEMKWEGDDRAETGFGRFLGIPREVANETVAWHQLKSAKILEWDRVWPIPQVEGMPAEIDESEGTHWLGRELLDELIG